MRIAGIAIVPIPGKKSVLIKTLDFYKYTLRFEGMAEFCYPRINQKTSWKGVKWNVITGLPEVQRGNAAAGGL